MKRVVSLAASLLLCFGGYSLYANATDDEAVSRPDSTDVVASSEAMEEALRPPSPGPRPMPGPGVRPRPRPNPGHVRPHPRPRPGPIVHHPRPHTGGHVWPNRRHNWNYYRWHFNPLRYPWYYYGYGRYPRGYYPGYAQGYYYTGYWMCSGYDDNGADANLVFRYRSTSYMSAYDAAFNACAAAHGSDCQVSCQRVQ